MFHVMATFDAKKLGHEEVYFAIRQTWLDNRGPLLIDATANVGFECMFLTASHDMRGGGYSVPVVARPITVKAHAWVCSRAILYNCTIEEGAVVAVGAVVRNVIVPKLCVVEGNPARIIKRWIPDKKLWEHCDEPCPPMTYQ